MTVPPESGSGQPEQPQLDPSGQWQWDPQQQQWIPNPLFQHPPAPTPDPTAGYQTPGYQNAGYQTPGYQADPNFGGGYPAPGAPAYAGAPAAGKPKSRKLIYIAAAVVVVVVAGVLVGVFALGGSSTKSPKSTVQTYLDDLAAGDAKGALAQGKAPASDTFTTDDILKQQQAKAKISNIKIVSSETRGTEAQVHATYQFGSRSADETFELEKSGGKWQLSETTYPITVTDVTDIPGVTFFGKSVANLSKVYVFPGPVLWGTSNKYFTVTDKQASEFAVSPYDSSGGYSELTTDLSADGKQAASDAVTAYFQKCAASKDLEPKDCPQEEYGLDDDTGSPQDGTATWTAPTGLTGLEYSGSSSPTKLNVSGSTVWKDTYQSKAYTDGAITTITNGNNKTSVYGTIDLSQNPPTFSSD